jgi:hypothetical protein
MKRDYEEFSPLSNVLLALDEPLPKVFQLLKPFHISKNMNFRQLLK